MDGVTGGGSGWGSFLGGGGSASNSATQLLNSKYILILHAYSFSFPPIQMMLCEHFTWFKCITLVFLNIQRWPGTRAHLDNSNKFEALQKGSSVLTPIHKYIIIIKLQTRVLYRFFTIIKVKCAALLHVNRSRRVRNFVPWNLTNHGTQLSNFNQFVLIQNNLDWFYHLSIHRRGLSIYDIKKY